jgi:glucosamine--fructose-6-phosphate aminotransferase (isomerizing)
VITIARGSSDNAASFFSYLVWRHLGLPVSSMPPSIATLYEKTPRASGRLALGISQSGESPDVVHGLELARKGGGFALAITNVAGSALTRAADEVVALECGPERAVAATKSFTASLAALLAIGLRWAKRDDVVAELARLPEAAARALDIELGQKIDILAKALESIAGGTPASTDSGASSIRGNLFVLGRGFTHALAQEAALKLKEVARLEAEAFSTHEFVHGPLGALEPGTPVLVILPASGPVRASAEPVLAKLAHAGARTVLVEGDASLPDELSPIAQAVVLQRLAVDLARVRGLDPDRPRNIEKVTRTW